MYLDINFDRSGVFYIVWFRQKNRRKGSRVRCIVRAEMEREHRESCERVRGSFLGNEGTFYTSWEIRGVSQSNDTGPLVSERTRITSRRGKKGGLAASVADTLLSFRSSFLLPVSAYEGRAMSR
jgi:hypothetical protein